MGRTKRDKAPGPVRVTNHYAVMGIHDFAPGSDARKAYHRLALRWHPDRQVHATQDCRKDAEDKFKEINEAYAVLSDDARRREFDESLRRDLLGMFGKSTYSTPNNPRPAATRTKVGERRGKPSESGVRLVMCPKCGTGAEAKDDDEKALLSMRCRQCTGFYHEVYCAGCKDWGATEGRRGESTMRCGCGNVFYQSRCPSCSQWNTFNGEVQGAQTRSCGFCSSSFHEAFCPGCSGWGIWKGAKGCRSQSCYCGGLFYEISCQSCGMWSSVKGRHSDNINNTLRCGTCGCESHEAFCPACGHWDSFLGSKGETTLVCRNSKCRGKVGIHKAGVMFFQVYCESCASWRSVLGAKHAVGGASVRCVGCKSTIPGTACPACGNWDKHNQQSQQQKQQQQQQQQQQDQRVNGDGITVDAGALDCDQYIPQCSSCGHQPPPDDHEGGHLWPRDLCAAFGVVVDESLDGESANAISDVEGGVFVGAIEETSSPPAFDVVDDAEPRASESVQPPLQTNIGETKSSARRKNKTETSSEFLGANDESTTNVAVVAASTSVGENYNDEDMDGVDPLDTSSQNRQELNQVIMVGGTTDNKMAASSPPIALECDIVDSFGCRESITDADCDCNVILTAGTSRGKLQSTPRAPLPSSGSRSSLHCRSSGRYYAPRATVTESLGAGAASTITSAGATQEDFYGKTACRGIASGAEAVSSESTTIGGTRNVGEVTDGVENSGGDSCTKSDGTWDKFERTSTEGVDLPEHGLLSQPSHPNRPRLSRGVTKNIDMNRRRSRLSRSLFPPASAGIDTVSSGQCCGQGYRTTAVDYNNGADEKAPATAGVTLAAVSREDSPPPPPGVRVGETGNTCGGEGRKNNPTRNSDTTEKRGPEGDVNRSRGGGGETLHGSRGRGKPGVLHLAFCPKCREYRGWRASFLERRVTGKTRKNCPDCGAALSGVSYYPTR